MRQSRLLLIASLVLMALHTARTAFISYLGIDPSWHFGLLAIVSLVLATRRYTLELGPPPSTAGFSTQLNLLVVSIVMLALLGYLNSNLTKHLILDAGVLIVFWCFLYLGRYERVWEDIENPIYIITAVSVFVVLAGLARAELHITYAGLVEDNVEIGSKGRWTTSTLGYKIRSLLYLTPIVFALSFARQSWDTKKLVGIGCMLVWFGLAICFWKRAPTVRVIGYVVMALLLGKRYSGKSNLVPMVVICLGGFIVLAYLGSRVDGLMERYRNTGDIMDNERFYEASMLFSDFNSMEYIFGRGLGGYYKVFANWELYTVVSQDGAIGRWTIHVGMLWPFLKGGILLCLIYFSFFARIFVRKEPGWYMNRYNFAAVVIVPIYWAYLLIDAPPSMSTGLNVATIGLCCARFGIPAGQTDFHNSYLHPSVPT